LEKIKIGVIGVGRLGPVHIKNLMRLNSKAKIIAVCDLENDLANYYAKITGTIPYNDYKIMLENEDIDAVFIITPTNKHDFIVKDCAEAKKHIFCEKPMAETLEKAIEMEKYIKKAKVKFQVGYMRRFDNAYTEAKRLVDEGKIGKPLVFKATSRDPFPPPAWACDHRTGGGLYIDLHTHDFDLARWFMKDEIVQVSVCDTNLLGLEYNIPNFVDNAVVSLKFLNGTIGVVDGSWNSKGGYDIRTEILGSEGTIIIGQLNFLPITLFTTSGVTQVSTFKSDEGTPHFMKRFNEAYFLEAESFVDCILEDVDPVITERDGIATLEIALAAQKSSESKSTVDLLR
jgi:predicted dehydrogenase